ncbi:M42 family peptidase [candidate division WOR-3 bacterium]|nr:M42 family peptidase [candidate division WOR-3 bacterium]
MKSTNERLRTFCEIPGLTGMEAAVAKKFIEEAKPFSDETYIDHVGNAVAVKRGSGKRKILAAAHMDEIGLIITKILKGGYLRVYQVGGVDRSILLGQEVVVHTSKGEIEGVVGSKPPHLMAPEEQKKPLGWDGIFIDTSLDEKEVVSKIAVGDFISFKANSVELLDKSFSSKSIDDRFGLAVLVMTLERLHNINTDWNFYAVGTVQEEWTGLGAKSSAYAINPDVAVALDVTHGNMPGLKESETFKLGKGITLSVGPNIHRGILSKAKKICEYEEIPYANEIAPYGTGTDAYTIQLIRNGIPCIVISAPVRSMHSPVETISHKDVERSARLLSSLVTELDDDDLDIDKPEIKEDEKE